MRPPRARGIDIARYELSHLAVRVPEWDQYVHLRTLLERHATANREGVWNGHRAALTGQQFQSAANEPYWVPQRLITATGPNPLPR